MTFLTAATLYQLATELEGEADRLDVLANQNLRQHWERYAHGAARNAKRDAAARIRDLIK